jgi:ppGpp synthetase/RelA/SpoT-type nucleotidyltranferase
MNTELLADYARRYESILRPIAEQLERFIVDQMQGESRIDRITARAKDPERFINKASAVGEQGKPRYEMPLVQIQDQIAARIVVLYIDDVKRIQKRILDYFVPIEVRTIVPDSHWEFGYFGQHYILTLPHDVIPPAIAVDDAPSFFELQIKTLFQHAWSEANHDLGYKPTHSLSIEQQRLLAYTSAQAWGADRVFQELVTAEQN